MKQTRQEMIDEREKIADQLRKATVTGDINMTKYAELNERYHELDAKIRKGK
jgi:DNA-binding GntR family transcriptional regulator